MQIKTKFNIGDKVWLLRGSKALQSEVTNIQIFIGSRPESMSELYSICIEEKNRAKKCYSMHESLLFASKEDLIKSL